MTKQIPLTRNRGFPPVQERFAIVDDDVYEWASKYKWRVGKWSGSTYYAIRSFNLGTKRKTGILHREIMNAPDGVHVDHINGNGLDCTRSNMRLCTQAENKRNRKINSNSKSGYKGACWNKSVGKWQAHIQIDGKKIHLGLHDSAENAARAYDKAAIEYHGEFAKPNF